MKRACSEPVVSGREEVWDRGRVGGRQKSGKKTGSERKYLRAKIRKIFLRKACTLLRRATNLFPTACSVTFNS